MAVRRGPGDLYGMVPRRVFPPFLRAEKWGRPQAKRLVLFPSPPQRAKKAPLKGELTSGVSRKPDD